MSNQPSIMPYASQAVLPITDTPVHHDGYVLDLEDPFEFSAEYSGAAKASQTITISASGAQNDVLNVTINGILVAVTVGATPTTATVAAQVANAINSTAALSGLVVASAAAAVVTVTAVNAGLGGNGITIAVATGSGAVAGTAGGAKLTGGSQIITPLENFSVQLGLSTVYLNAGRSVAASPQLANAIVASGRRYK